MAFRPMKVYVQPLVYSLFAPALNYVSRISMTSRPLRSTAVQECVTTGWNESSISLLERIRLSLFECKPRLSLGMLLQPQEQRT